LWNVLLVGLLTVDPQQRLTVQDALHHSWLTGGTQLPHTPLMTPGVLGRSHKRTYVESALNVTYDAFNKAKQQGFTLMDVENAPLAKRRKLKKTTSSDSQSTTSTCSEQSGGLSPVQNNR